VYGILRFHGLIPISITIAGHHESLLANLSKYLNRPLYVEVYRHPMGSMYVVLAYTSDPGLCEYFRKIRRMYEYKIVGITCENTGDASYFIALKSKCEFYEILEKYGVIVLMPYIFKWGKRFFNALIDEAMLKNFLKELYDRYGRKNVYFEKTKTIDVTKKLYSNVSLLEKCLKKLTRNEVKVLKLALKRGYFNIPRKSTLDQLGLELNLSKVTVEIHLRKALKKIIESIEESNML